MYLLNFEIKSAKKVEGLLWRDNSSSAAVIVGVGNLVPFKHRSQSFIKLYVIEKTRVGGYRRLRVRHVCVKYA